MADMDETMTTITVLTRNGLARAAAARWRATYFLKGVWRHGDDKREIGERLAALVDPTPADVNAIIGNDSWTHIRCNECEREVECVAEMGEPNGDESQTVNLCLDCLQRAVAALVKVDHG